MFIVQGSKGISNYYVKDVMFYDSGKFNLIFTPKKQEAYSFANEGDALTILQNKINNSNIDDIRVVTC